jgi:hypothetical protein
MLERSQTAAGGLRRGARFQHADPGEGLPRLRVDSERCKEAKDEDDNTPDRSVPHGLSSVFASICLLAPGFQVKVLLDDACLTKPNARAQPLLKAGA